MIKYTIENWKDLNRSSGWNAKENPILVETAGFVPLEVKIKQLEENGVRRQMSADMSLTSAEMRQIYLHPDFEITPYDDLEEVESKLEARRLYIGKLFKQHAASDSVVDKPVSEAVGESDNKKNPNSSTDSAQELSSK